MLFALTIKNTGFLEVNVSTFNVVGNRRKGGHLNVKYVKFLRRRL